MRHVVPGGTGSWLREYAYESHSNRLTATSYPGDPDDSAQWSAQYSYDAAGNMLALPHVPGMKWDTAESLVAAELGGGGTATYTYDGSGQRVRKRVERSAGEVVERVYVGGFERYRRTRGGQVVEASTTKHVAGSIVETWTHRNGGELSEPERVVRYPLSDRVGSSTLETDDTGNVISLEEYFPFGQTAYSAASGVAETSLKRYRFAGKERDEETGLYYIGARYYASWLGRWTAVDPLARGGPRNGYVYAANRPLDVVDPDGRQEHVLDTEAGLAGVDQPVTSQVRNEARKDALYARVNARKRARETVDSAAGISELVVQAVFSEPEWGIGDEIAAALGYAGRHNPVTAGVFAVVDAVGFLSHPIDNTVRMAEGAVDEVSRSFTAAGALFTGDFGTYFDNHPLWRRAGNVLGAIKKGERIVPAAIGLANYGEGLIAQVVLAQYLPC